MAKHLGDRPPRPGYPNHVKLTKKSSPPLPYDDDEVSEVTNLNQLGKRMSDVLIQTSRSNRLLEQIPEIREMAALAAKEATLAQEQSSRSSRSISKMNDSLKDTQNSIVAYSVEIREMKSRQDRMADKIDSVNHQCSQLDRISFQAENINSIKKEQTILEQKQSDQAEVLTSVGVITEENKAELVDIRKGRRAYIIGFGVVFVGAILSGFAAFYSAGQVSQKIEVEVTERREANKRIENNMDQIQKQLQGIDTSSVSIEIRQLKNAINQSREHDYSLEEWYEGLSVREKRGLKKIIPAKKSPEKFY